MLELDKIVLKFKADDHELTALKEISLHFETGNIYVITGPNGSGKSSLARVIMGIHRPGSGRVIFDGKDITGLGITERSRKGIGYAFQHPARFKGLRVADILEIAMRNGEHNDCHYLSELGLCPEDYLERPLDASLSGGEIKRIEIATLLALNPRLRIFDEPEAGIDLWSFEQLIEVIGASHRPDTTTIIISHQEKILQMADQIILLEDGAVSLHGPREQIWPVIRDSVRCACRQDCSRGGMYYVNCPR